MTTELTHEQIQAIMEDLVEQYGPDFVYERRSDIHGTPQCWYTSVRDDDSVEPSCLVGQVLHRAGVGLIYLREREGCSASSVLDELQTDALLLTSTRTVTALAMAQKVQDNGGTWGAALQAFRTY